jgi:hypothetical protein
MSSDFNDFCDKHGIKREYTIPGTPQQNGVVERQNRTFQQMVRSMMNEKNIGQNYWVEAIQTTIHILNKSHLIPHSDKTPYEPWYGRSASIKHFKVFGRKCYIKNNNENLGKYDDKSDEGIFLGYVTNSKGYKFFNKRLHKLVDCIDLKVDEGVPIREVRNIESTIEDTAETEDEQVQESNGQETPRQQELGQQSTSNPSSRITQNNHPESQIIGEKDKGVQTRRRITKDTEKSHMAFISMVEPKNINESIEYVNWLKSMNEELDQIEKNDNWELVPRPTNKNVVESKWVYKNKMNEKGNIVRNKARLVCK